MDRVIFSSLKLCFETVKIDTFYKFLGNINPFFRITWMVRTYVWRGLVETVREEVRNEKPKTLRNSGKKKYNKIEGTRERKQ